MAPATLLLFRRRLRLRPSMPMPSSVIRKTEHFLCANPFSSSPQPLLQADPGPPLPTTPPPPDPKAGLSARMSFVFDQIDAMERMRGAKDEALQRIRAWRQAKEQPQQQHQDGGAGGFVDARGIDLGRGLAAEVERSQVAEGKGIVTEEEGGNAFKTEVELVHPWPEWIELMELLVKQNYFDHRRFDEDQMVRNLPLDLSGVAEDVGFDFTRDWATVRTACLNFGRDRFDILRSLSKKDLQIIVGNGCASTDKKVVFSAKLLRKHAHLDEGDVCSSCKLRNTCSSGYLPTRKEDEARTLDVMRILLTFGFDSINGSVENKAIMKMKSVKTAIRKLLHDIIKLGAVPIDPNLPLPEIKRSPPKVKQPPPPPKKRVGRDDIEMKKGDWLCPKCDFMNFAKNIVCLQCDANRPKRQLLPGEWECPECNFLNYRRNMSCFHCDRKRPPDEFTENKMQFKRQGSQTRVEKTAGLSNVSNAWNFDFDDNESDGADVAAFEFADSPRINDDSLDGLPQRGVGRGFEDGISEANNVPKIHDRGRYFSEPDERTSSHVSRTGFDDFDDEDDDVDSYEIDDRPAKTISEVSQKNMSEFRNSAESEDFDDFDSGYKPHQSFNRASHDSEDDDDDGRNIYSDFEGDISNHPQWKSFEKRTGVTSGKKQDRGMSLGSDEDIGLDSDFDDDMDRESSSKLRRSVEKNCHRRGPERMRNYHSSDEVFGSEPEAYAYSYSVRNKAQGNGSKGNIRRNSYREHGQADSPSTRVFEPGHGMGNQRISYGNTNDDWSYGGTNKKNRGARVNGNRARRVRNENYDLQRFDGPRKERFGYMQGRKFNQLDDRSRHFDGYRRTTGSDIFYDRHGAISKQFIDQSRVLPLPHKKKNLNRAWGKF